MSRSRRKVSKIGNGSESDKPYKKIRHGQERARTRNAIAAGEFELAEGELAPYDPWDSCKDGKSYFDAHEKPELMRK